MRPSTSFPVPARCPRAEPSGQSRLIIGYVTVSTPLTANRALHPTANNCAVRDYDSFLISD